MNIEHFLSHIDASAKELRDLHPQEVLLLHHNDTDGLTSGAILHATFERHGIPLRSYCLEKPYPPVLSHILQDPALSPNTILLFADFGSGMLPTIDKLNVSHLPIFILDHHTIESSSSANIKLVNCRTFDICGSRQCSASTICSLFAQSFSKHNEDLLTLGLLGAYGDSQYLSDGSFEGLNGLLFQKTLSAGTVSFDNTLRMTIGQSYPASSLKEWLDHLGSIG
ncbi:MAG: DHH family phosphoesterase, partial [Bdellovibrionales bacterium]|nr:DHH family phosphoesterase [Bdellovibrionales bacterium]